MRSDSCNFTWADRGPVPRGNAATVTNPETDQRGDLVDRHRRGALPRILKRHAVVANSRFQRPCRGSALGGDEKYTADGGARGWRAAFLQLLQTCAAGIATAYRGGHTPYLGQSWAYGIVGYSTGHFLQSPDPQDPNCSTNGTGGSMNPGSFNMTSNHLGGSKRLALRRLSAASSRIPPTSRRTGAWAQSPSAKSASPQTLTDRGGPNVTPD